MPTCFLKKGQLLKETPYKRTQQKNSTNKAFLQILLVDFIQNEASLSEEFDVFNFFKHKVCRKGNQEERFASHSDKNTDKQSSLEAKNMRAHATRTQFPNILLRTKEKDISNDYEETKRQMRTRRSTCKLCFSALKTKHIAWSFSF